MSQLEALTSNTPRIFMRGNKLVIELSGSDLERAARRGRWAHEKPVRVVSVSKDAAVDSQGSEGKVFHSAAECSRFLGYGFNRVAIAFSEARRLADKGGTGGARVSLRGVTLEYV